PFRLDEGADLDAGQAGVAERLDQPQLLLDLEVGRFVLQPVARADFVEDDALGQARHRYSRGRTLPRTQSAIDFVVAPGVKISATPSFFNSGMSASGMMPPPKRTTSFTPCA